MVRECPALWLPVMVADLSAFALRSSRHAAIPFAARLILPLFHGHSVLVGSTAPVESTTARALVFGIAALIGFTLQTSSIACYAIAFFVTARMVWQRDERLASGGRPREGRAIVELSVRGLLVTWALGIVEAFVLWAVMKTRWHAAATWWIVSIAISAVTMSVFAYVMVPPAMRLLRGSRESPGDRSIGLGRKCAVAAVIASMALAILEHIILGIIYGSRDDILAIRAMESLIVALPYAPLYVALSLLAGDERAEVPDELAEVPGSARAYLRG